MPPSAARIPDQAEIEKLIKAARDGRYGRRDATLILIAFRHGRGPPRLPI